VAFGNYDFIKRNIDSTANLDNGIRSYSLYWVLSLLDYYMYTGDAATLERYVANACAKLDDAVPNTQCGITSLCHPWGAGPVKWLNEEVLGTATSTRNPDSEGPARIRFFAPYSPRP